MELRLADAAGYHEIPIAITVCHYPPGTSKWNKIEHRLFSFIALNWKGVPLVNFETVVDPIGATRTRTGLRVRAMLLDTNEYQKGSRCRTRRWTAFKSPATASTVIGLHDPSRHAFTSLNGVPERCRRHRRGRSFPWPSRATTRSGWGRNAYGELGDGTQDDRWRPVEVQIDAVPADQGNLLRAVKQGDDVFLDHAGASAG